MGDGIRRNGRRRRAAGVTLLPGRPALPAQCVLQAPYLGPARGRMRSWHALAGNHITPSRHTRAAEGAGVAAARVAGTRVGKNGAVPSPGHAAGPVRSLRSRAARCHSGAKRRSCLCSLCPGTVPWSFKRKKILHAGGFHVLKPDRQASSADHSENTGYGTVRHVLHRMRGPHQGFPAAAATSAHNGCPRLRRKPDHRSPAVVSYWAGVSRAPPASCQTD